MNLDLRPLVWLAVIGMVLGLYEGIRLIIWICHHVTIGWK